MSNIEIELNTEGVRSLLKSNEMKDFLGNMAKEIKNSLPEGYGYGTRFLSTRAVASVRAATKKAARDNMENNTLLKAVSK